MKKNDESQNGSEISDSFWGILLGSVLIYIFVLSVIYCKSGFSFSFKDVDIDVTHNYLTDLFVGLTLIVTFASIWLFYKTLKSQQEEIQKNQLRFELQQFENNFFRMLEKLQTIRDNLEIEDEFYLSQQKRYKGLVFFKYNTYVLWFLRQALIKSVVINEPSWDDHLSASSADRTPNEEFEMQYLARYEPEKCKEIEDSVKRDRKTEYASFKFKISKDLLKTTDGFTDEKKEAWSCKNAFNRVYRYFHDPSDLYFSHLMNTLKYIDINSKLFENSKDLNIKDQIQLYASMLSSGMYQSELAFVFYYAYTLDDVERLCVKYKLFEKLDSKYLLDRKHATLIEGVEIKNMQEHYDARKNLR